LRSQQQQAKEIVVRLNRLESNLPEQLSEIWQKVKLLSALICDYFDGRYRGKIKSGKIMQIIAALLYLLMPMDILFDGIPVVGFSDDLIVLTKVLDGILDDLKAYERWGEK